MAQVSGTGTQREKESQARVREALKALDLQIEFRTFSELTRTSQEAADAIGCLLAQIAKSLVFRTVDSDRPVLVVASGKNRVDLKALKALLGEKVERASPDFVRERTGFTIGGVSLVGHLEQPVVFIDEDLLAYDVIWAAAGTPFSVFPLRARDLQRVTGGTLARLRQS